MQPSVPPLYGTQPPQINAAYGTVPPPSQPFYGAPPAPPSQPLYGYGTPQAQPPLYSAPATVPFAPPLQGAPVSQTLFGPNAVPGAAQPYSRIQALLMRNLSAGAVVTPWITAIIGAIAALVVGLILTALGGALWSNALSDLLNNALAGASGSSAGTLGEFTGVAQQALSPDLLKLFALAHHVSLNVGASAVATGAAANGSLSLGIPLTGLFLAPALALTLGGYIAASSDFSRRARYSMARGALIAPFYAVLLVICALIGSSTASASGSAGGLLQGSGAVTIAPSVGEAALYGLLWGLLFGALGGWIHVSGRVWLSSALATLQTVRNGRLAGALAGAGAALVTGIVLFSAAFIGVAAFSGISSAAASTAAAGSAPSIVTTLTLYLFFAPVAAVYLFALGTGAPIGAFVTDSTNQLNSSVTISLLNGYQATAPSATSGAATPATPVATPLPHFPPSPVFYLLILGALISYLVGGRVAARVARARLAGDGFVAGALMAVPLSLLMTFAAYLAAAVLTISVSAGGQSETLGVSASPVYGGMFLAVLIAGAVCGGIGGASVSAMPGLGALPRALLLPFRPVSRLLSPLLDGLTGRDRRQPPSLGTQWIYDGVGAAVVLGILAVALDILNGAAPKLLPFAALWLVEAIVAALLVGVPLACFLGALLAAFTSPAPLAPAPMLPPLPAPPSVPAYATVPASIPGMYAPSMPLPQYPPSPQYPQYPQYSQYPPTPAPTQPESPPPAPYYGASSPGTPPQPPF